MGIVTVTYSPGDHLRALVASLSDACQQDTLLVCADNGSRDGVPQAVAAEEPGVEFRPTGGNIGYGAAINAGVKELALRRSEGTIDGRWFVLVNPDVQFDEGAIDEMIACLEAHPDAGAVGPRIEEADGSNYPSARELPTLGTGIGHALLGNVWPSNPFTRAYKAGEDLSRTRTAGWLSGSCLLVRWEAFEAIGGFDERYFMYMEDTDFGDRLARAGWSNVFCHTAVIRHDQGHSAKKHSKVTVPAHHASAYRYQADRHTRLREIPLRAALWAGLKLRSVLSLLRG
nr:glycosyltransferase family 2 protein [Corynebacterium aquatimens]